VPSEQSAAALALGPPDLEDCLALDAAALGGFWSQEQWLQELSAARRPCLGLRAAGQLQAVACGWLVIDELHITVVAVQPQQRRQGLGSQVLQALLACAQAEGAAHATLEVASANHAAQALYAKAGFSTAGIRRRYYRNGDDALIQWCRLVPSQSLG
jgi:ribosomal-protein-alanine N-acetyltransferase